ncbi:MAG: tRNA pseudouridine(38-40) synthase TruA [Bacilli bacterium]|nr:tRNA pseudouridine(38-40) synthase TruA [Bacilli bacterium]
MRYLATTSYFGMNYVGWQVQPSKNSIEEKIEKLLSSILNEKINIIGSGRTDKGVHAYAQTFHFDSKKEIKDVKHLVYALNRLLPKDIYIKSLKPVRDDFHARFSAIKKEYLYKLYLGQDRPFYTRTHMIIKDPLDLKLLKDAAKLFIGKHNFQNLTSKERDDKNFIRTIYDIKVKKIKDEVIITVIGNAFMRYMVRDIVGEMVMVASKKKSLNQLKNIFKGPRKITNIKAPAEGLYLKKVYYAKD